MEVRPLAVTAGVTTLVVLGLAGAVLLGERSQVPERHDPPAQIAIARPEPSPVAGDADLTPTPEPEPEPTPQPPGEPAPVVRPPHRVMPIPHHHVVRAPPPAEPAPPAVVQAPPATPPVLTPAPPPLWPRPPVVDHRYDGVLTVAEIGRLKRSLRLSPDQEPYWPPLAAVLREVGRRQMAQVDAGQRPTFDLPGDLSSRLYSAAMPLLGTLREDQKEVVRRHAKSLGLDSVASFI